MKNEIVQGHVDRLKDFINEKHPEIDTADVLSLFEILSDPEYPTCITCTVYPPGTFLGCPSLLKMMDNFAEECVNYGVVETFELFKGARDLADHLMPDMDSKNANFVIKYFEWFMKVSDQ